MGRFNIFSLEEFEEKLADQKQECKDIHNKHGLFLFKIISQKRLDEISSGARQNVILGLYNFTK